MAPTLAIIYGTRGGLSDVGKLVVLHASVMAGVTVQPVAVYDGRDEADVASRPGHEADVTEAGLNVVLVEALRKANAPVVDVHSDATDAALEAAIRGADAVVCAFSSRQPDRPRYLTIGMLKVVKAMQACRVSRLVVLSSFGIGDDFMPLSPIKVLWACFLNTINNAAKRDLITYEAVVEASGLDYAILRPMGLTPTEPSVGKYTMRTAPKQGGLQLSIAKSDMALCCVQEALAPTLHRAAATVGAEPPGKK
ncbi:NADH(P)-binding-domain-containing protein [Pavlovales sp. CCMP2436]|nr:NADH(P)-binding-domain-containing protein [Pavlovales sp. CCMP2436]|mmetsp:Transcript_21020/g.52333  ORF Transcript_21020/g.52333 Transcript_21020/m.52333 type:complete len:252 (+) Transcript_21020:2-757(+)